MKFLKLHFILFIFCFILLPFSLSAAPSSPSLKVVLTQGLSGYIPSEKINKLKTFAPNLEQLHILIKGPGSVFDNNKVIPKVKEFMINMKKYLSFMGIKNCKSRLC